MKSIIGHTGFVGSTLLRQGGADVVFNSSTIGDMRQQSFDTIWCAGVRAVKWWANQNPSEDWQNIKSLLDTLNTVTCRHFILISTVDVFAHPIAVDETSAVDIDNLYPYGKHRYAIEQFVEDRFPSHTIIRLPGLFGHGLKKNIIYDFMHDNEVYKIHSEAKFQFYDLKNIYTDCIKTVNAGIKRMHFATAPVSVGEIAREAFNQQFDNRPNGITPALYDFRTIHADLWGQSGAYIYGKSEVLDQVRTFVQSSRTY